jgi:hypothetical protein
VLKQLLLLLPNKVLYERGRSQWNLPTKREQPVVVGGCGKEL